MAAPAEITIHNLNGKWTMNKTLSDSQDPFFSLQGIGWVTRKAIGIATVTLVIKQYTDAEGVVNIEITSSAGLTSTREDRVLNWAERDHKDQVFGLVKGRSRFTKKAEFQSDLQGVTDDEKKYLLAERLADGSPSAFLDEELIQSAVVNMDGNGWTVDQVWGFEEIKGERRYTRRLLGKQKGKTQMMRLVYDYNGPLN